MSGAGGAQPPFGPIGVMRSWLRTSDGGRRGFGAWWAWVIFILGALYFILPLVGVFFHSIRTRPDIFLAYRQVFADPAFLRGLGYSFTAGVITVVVSLLIIVPTAY
jgi:putative spermidine/putrescine transport system permease protein